MDLSIVIPVLNERKKIRNDIFAASEFLVKNKMQGEILIVDDGSTDNTVEIARKTEVSSEVALHVLHNSDHQGKGFAVKTGILRSTGKIFMFIDSGLCVPYENILLGFQLIANNNCDIAHGSRFLKQSRIIQPHHFSRQISSALFRKIFKLLLGIPSELTDTQCGLKMYRGNVGRNLFKDCVTKGFMFDIEIILRAKKMNYRIKEFPIEWTADHDSRLSQTNVVFTLVKDLVKIRKTIKKEF